MVPDTEVLSRSKPHIIEANIIKHCLRWSIHVMRIGETRLPKMILLSKFNSETRRVLLKNFIRQRLDRRTDEWNN